MSATLHGIGIGPGDPELITLRALRLLQNAAVVAYPAPDDGDSLARSIAAPHLPPSCTEYPIRIPMTAERFPAHRVYDEAAAALGRHLDAGREVVVLCEGDPFFYGSFMYLFARMAGPYPVEITPGVSSLSACAATLGHPLAARHDVLSVVPATLDTPALRAALQSCEAAAIIKIGRHFARVLAVLDELGLREQARYIERATLPQQRIVPLAEVEPDAAPYFSMILLHRRGRAW